jgi:hypothetical protein
MPVIETGIWKRLSTNNIKLRGLRDDNDGSYPQNATVKLYLYDSTGAPVATVQNVDMPYVTGTTGAQTAYRGSVAHTVGLAAGSYTAEVIAVLAGGLGQRRFVKPITVED